MTKKIYRIDGDRYWDVDEGKWIEEGQAEAKASQGYELDCLRSAEGVSDEAYLIRTLKFYRYPLGELAGPADRKTLETRLAEMEAEMSAIKTEMAGAVK